MLYCGLYAHLAKMLSFVLGVPTTGYLLNRRLLFQAPDRGEQFASMFGLYALTFAVKIGVNAVVLTNVTHILAGTTLVYVIAQRTAAVINFIVPRTVTIRDPSPSVA